MKLSDNVISEFVKMTNDTPSTSTNQSKIYGTAIIYNDEQYVQLDGSDLLTPADNTVHIKNGERVTVSIQNHVATIDGNISDISASNQHLVSVDNDLVNFKITTEGMFVEVRDEFNTKLTDFKVTVDGMFLEVRNETEQKFSDFRVTVDGMFLSVRNDMDQKFSDFKVTVDGMFLEVRDETEQKISTLKTTVDGTFVEVRNEIDQKVSTLKTTVDGTFVTVNQNINDLNSKYSSLKVTTDNITTEVGKKVNGSDLKTIVTQNADSWRLSINGKLSGTYYNFDGTNFSIGSSNGSTTAYHASGYSKWTHSDGSWTWIDANGLTWHKSGSSSGYHYLLYAGEYTCNSEETVTITLPDEFKGKNFKVVTSIKRIFIAYDEYVTGCYFPLLSFYAEANNIDRANGRFSIYASIRAWNRVGYGGWGQLIGNGSSAGERDAIKPVVAYWAFV